MGVPQMLGNGGRSQIYSLVIADDAIQRVGNWQMLGEGMVERGEERQGPVDGQGSGITAPGRRINHRGERRCDFERSMWRVWGYGNDVVLNKRHSVTPFQF